MTIRELVRRVLGRGERRYTLAEAALILQRIPTANIASTGIAVTEDRAIAFAAVYACVRVLAESVSTLPLVLYRRRPGGGRERAADHPLYPILHDRPNPVMTSVEFRETLQGHLCLRGNAYALIVRDEAGRVRELWPLRPDQMEVRVQGARYVYVYRPKYGEMAVYEPEEILHVKGLSPDGLVGYSPIKLAREAIGLGLAAQEYGAKLFANDARPGGVLKTDQELDEESMRRLRRQWEEAHRGSSNAWRVAVLERGLEWQAVGIAPEDAQFLETRKFQVTEIARIFRIPPHMIGDLERATFSNIEQQSLEFVIHTLRPWLVRWEQAISARLLTEEERRELYAEHLVDGLLRGDIQSRYEAYTRAIQWGILSPNEVRELENRNPRRGGDAYLMPLNMVPYGEAAGAGRLLARRAGAAGLPAGARMRQRLQRAYRRLLRREWERVVRRERNDILAEARKRLKGRGVTDFEDWLRDFYQGHPEWVREQLAAAYAAFADAVGAAAAEEVAQEWEYSQRLQRWVEAYLDRTARQHASGSLAQIIEVIRRAQEEGQDVIESLEERFGEWLEGGEAGTTRPEKLAGRESVRFGQGFARAVFAAAGVTLLQWAAAGETCPYCLELDGTVVGVEEHFVQDGGGVAPEGEQPLLPGGAVGHPPLHAGCDCVVVPVVG